MFTERDHADLALAQDLMHTVRIPLSGGKAFALVDTSDAPLVSAYGRWFLTTGLHTSYAQANFRQGDKVTQVYMHRVITAATRGQQVDHINRDGLDNRRRNLRLVDASQNQGNQGLPAHNTSGYKGVTRCGRTGKWIAQITIGRRRRILGRYLCREDAAVAYDEAALTHWGEHAFLNFARPGHPRAIYPTRMGA